MRFEDPEDFLAEYQQLAARTISPKMLPIEGPPQLAHWKSIGQRLSVKQTVDLQRSKELLTMAALGIAGELQEFDEAWTRYCAGGGSENMVKEAGDVLWYGAAIFTAIGKPMELEDTYSSDRATSALRICEITKKYAFHNDSSRLHELPELVSKILNSVLSICETYGIKPVYIAGKNIEKLEARYPDGFNL